MKNILKLTVLGLAMFGLSHAGFAATGPVLSINPAHETINGNTVTLTLNISGLKYGDTQDDPGSPSLGAFNLVLDYNPAVLTYLPADTLIGTQLVATGGMDVDGSGDFPEDNTAYASESGVIELNDISFDSGSDLDASQSAAFALASVSFEITSGSSQLTWDATTDGGTSLSDETGVGTLAFTTANPVTISSNGTTISVVPEPSTYAAALCGLGMLAVGLIKRRRLTSLHGA